MREDYWKRLKQEKEEKKEAGRYHYEGKENVWVEENRKAVGNDKYDKK